MNKLKVNESAKDDCPGYPAMLVYLCPSMGHLSPIFQLGPEKREFFSGPHSFKTGHFSNQNRPLGVETGRYPRNL